MRLLPRWIGTCVTCKILSFSLKPVTVTFKNGKEMVVRMCSLCRMKVGVDD